MLTAQGELGRGPLLLPHVENEKGWRHKFYCFSCWAFFHLEIISLSLQFFLWISLFCLVSLTGTGFHSLF